MRTEHRNDSIIIVEYEEGKEIVETKAKTAKSWCLLLMNITLIPDQMLHMITFKIHFSFVLILFVTCLTAWLKLKWTNPISVDYIIIIIIVFVNCHCVDEFCFLLLFLFSFGILNRSMNEQQKQNWITLKNVRLKLEARIWLYLFERFAPCHSLSVVKIDDLSWWEVIIIIDLWLKHNVKMYNSCV